MNCAPAVPPNALRRLKIAPQNPALTWLDCADTVPGGPSIACSTAAAIEWDEEFKRAALEVGGDQSGRSVDVHDSAYKDVVAVASGRERAEAEAAKKSAAKL